LPVRAEYNEVHQFARLSEVPVREGDAK